MYLCHTLNEEYTLLDFSVCSELGHWSSGSATDPSANHQPGQRRTDSTWQLIAQTTGSACQRVILDRQGIPMVNNQPTYTIMLTPRFFKAERTSLLATLLEVEDSTVTAELEAARAWNNYRPSPSFPDISFENFSRIQENIFRLPGVNHEINQKRIYLTEARAAHALGYLGEISRSELESLKDPTSRSQYRQGDLLGKTGVERHYETILRGTPGITHQIVNVHGINVAPYTDGVEDEPPEEIYNIHLALDAEVQALAESLFVNKRGAVVAMDPSNGGLITLLSMPDFHSNIFSQRLDWETWDSLNTHPDKPYTIGPR